MLNSVPVNPSPGAVTTPDVVGRVGFVLVQGRHADNGHGGGAGVEDEWGSWGRGDACPAQFYGLGAVEQGFGEAWFERQQQGPWVCDAGGS
ncbi:hypothetical protein GCM10027521_35490 [Amycolatopsis cihanbeyliensis]